MTDAEKLALLEEFAKFLEDEFIVEGCDPRAVEGCMSCDAVWIKQWVEGKKEFYDPN